MVTPVGGDTSGIRLMLTQLYQSRLYSSLAASTAFGASKTGNYLTDLTTSFVSDQAQAAYDSLYRLSAGADATTSIYTTTASTTNSYVAAGDFWSDRASTAGSDMERLRYLNNALGEYNRASATSAGQAGLGAVYDQLGMADEALTAYEKAVRLDGNSYDARMKLGSAYADRDKTAEATAQFNEAIRLEPTRTDAYLSLSNLYSAQGDDGEARATLTRGLSYNPGSKVLTNALNALKTTG